MASCEGVNTNCQPLRQRPLVPLFSGPGLLSFCAHFSSISLLRNPAHEICKAGDTAAAMLKNIVKDIDAFDAIRQHATDHDRARDTEGACSRCPDRTPPGTGSAVVAPPAPAGVATCS